MPIDRILISLLLAVLSHALPPAVQAQESTTLPQIRLVNQRSAIVSNLYLCVGSDWAACRTTAEAKVRADPSYSFPESDNLGGRKVSPNETVDLGGVGSFALFLTVSDLVGRLRFMRVVDVHPGAAPLVSVTAPLTGTLQASGAMASLNGVAVTQGDTLFSVVRSVPRLVDFDVVTYNSSSPAVAFSVATQVLP